MVAPFTGAWIEIANMFSMPISIAMSHPSRVRGLKLAEHITTDTSGDAVAPFTGAWIEIASNRSSRR